MVIFIFHLLLFQDKECNLNYINNTHTHTQTHHVLLEYTHTSTASKVNHHFLRLSKNILCVREVIMVSGHYPQSISMTDILRRRKRKFLKTASQILHAKKWLCVWTATLLSYLDLFLSKRCKSLRAIFLLSVTINFIIYTILHDVTAEWYLRDFAVV